jgi:predicted methyltransferase
MKNTFLALITLAVFSPLSVADVVEDAINKPGRMESDIARDARSHPEAVLPLLQLEPGDRVADIWAGGGYYSELLANIVGAEGEVLLINNAAYKSFAKKGLDQRFDGREVPGITLHDREAEDLDLGENTLDAAIIIMSYHDLYHVDEKGGWRAIDPVDFLGQIHRGLKPGGRFLIVDHHAEPGSGNAAAQDLHRIDVDFAKADIESRGFKLVGSSDALRNPDDDYSVMVFQPEVRGKTDRFILAFEKVRTPR